MFRAQYFRFKLFYFLHKKRGNSQSLPVKIHDSRYYAIPSLNVEKRMSMFSVLK